METIENVIPDKEKLTEEKLDLFEKVSTQIELLAKLISGTSPACYEKREALKKLFQVKRWVEKTFEKPWFKDGVKF